MPETIYITASCTISNHIVRKNGSPVFENKSAGLPDFLLSVYQHFNYKYPKFYKMDTLSKLGWLAAEVLLQDHPTAKEYQPEETAIVLANKNASLDTDIRYFETTNQMASPALFVYTLPNIVTGEICIRHHFKGENAFFIQEQFDADFIREYVEGLLNNNIAASCICGWVECLDDQYETILLYAEKKKSTASATIFTTDNILKLYSTQNG